MIEWQKWESPFEKHIEETYNEDERGLGYTKIFLKILEKEFNLWTIHTNFYIDESVASAIELTEGVETIDVLSPYRARIGIGKLFDEETIQVQIRRSVQKILDRRTRGKKISFIDAVNRFLATYDNSEEERKSD